MTEEMFLHEIEKLGLSLTEIQMHQFEKYYELLITWNERINLTAITEKKEVYLKHFYDSATLVKAIDFLKEETLCDVGSGAGFPGIVLKILFPNLKITLVDSLNKRINFLKEVIKELDLKEIKAVHARAEEFSRLHREEFDIVTARAVAQLNVLLEYTIPMVKVGKYFIAMKGNISQEIVESKHACKELDSKIIEEISFPLPVDFANRTLLLIQKEKQTKKIYPRKFSEIKKKPL